MSKPRSIDPMFWDDRDINLLSRDERLLVIGMVSVFADDEGRLVADPNALRKRLFADDRDITTEMVDSWVQHIAAKWHNFKLYVVRDRQYAWFASWERWQPMKYKAKSKLPEFSPNFQIVPNSPNLPQFGTVEKSFPNLPQFGTVEKSFPNLAIGRDGSVGLGCVELSTEESVEIDEPENQTPPPPLPELESVPVAAVPVQATERTGPVLVGRPSWTLDEMFASVVAIAREFWPDSIDEDFTDAYFAWRKLDPDQRMGAAFNLREKQAAEPGQGRFVCKNFGKYLATPEWKRKARDPTTQSPKIPAVTPRMQRLLEAD